MRRAGQHGARRQRGIAAVELAIVMPVLVLLLVFPLYLGRVFWHYTAIQYAAQDAARYLSKAPASEMGNPTRGVAVAAVAQAIVAQELAELAPGSFPYLIQVGCDGVPCAGYGTPTVVRVSLTLYMEDIFFANYTGMNLQLTVDVTYP
jgi:Flp pilus assembly protein TadG